MKWRRLNNILHRDIGYLCVGLTIVYAVSGIAVNHAQDWNPNYKITHSKKQIDPVNGVGQLSFEHVNKIIRQLDIKEDYRSFFQPDPETIKIFFEKKNVTVYLSTGEVEIEDIASRTVLREMNYLHLNRPKKLWTVMADIYAGAIFLLAITGLLVLKGKNGLRGRGKWLTGIGIVIPVIFSIMYL